VIQGWISVDLFALIRVREFDVVARPSFASCQIELLWTLAGPSKLVVIKVRQAGRIDHIRINKSCDMSNNVEQEVLGHQFGCVLRNEWLIWVCLAVAVDFR